MRDNYQCEECKNTTNPDQFACNCLCINCGPCDNGDCQYGKETKDLCGTSRLKETTSGS